MTRPPALPSDSKPALTPKLRFPEFRDGPGWADATVEELVDTITPPKKLPTSVYAGNGRFPIIDQSQTAVCGWTDDSESLILSALPLIVFGDHTCILKLIDQPFAQGADGIKILKARPKVDPRFLYHSLSHRPVATEEYKRHYSILKDRQVAFPDIKAGEQQKIADFLSTLDELIGAERRKFEALKAHKKGLMQQLLPREGETLPRLRFPEFQSAPEWNYKPLGELGEIVTGKTPSTRDAGLWGGDILFITPTDIANDGKYQRTTARTVVETDNTKVLPAGCVVYTCIASIGKMAITTRPSITNQQINAIVARDGVNAEFVFYALADLTPWIQSIPASSTLPIINKTEFSKISIPVPNELEEQHRIAACFSSLDDLIAAQSDRLSALQTHKQSLMQQLFPSPVEN